jgi:hypothetical protein
VQGGFFLRKKPLSDVLSVKSRIENAVERFSNSCALAGIAQGGFFSGKKPLEGSGFGVQQLENRCRAFLLMV